MRTEKHLIMRPQLILLFCFFTSALSCGFPGAPAHSTVAYSAPGPGATPGPPGPPRPGTVATYTCDRGFELLGPARKICLANATWSPPGIPFCVLNVAAGKAPMQSSVAAGGIPQKAVDGSTATAFTDGTCSLTEVESAPWWYVNLLEPYMVQLVRLDFGADCCGDREATIVVRVGNNRPDLGVNPVCNRFRGRLREGRPLFLPCNPPMPGAFVSVHFEGRGALSLCEAFVYTDQALPIERCPSFRGQPLGSTATYNGKCYIFHSDISLPFDAALETCRDHGGSLIDETNPALQGFLSWELWMRHRGDPKGQYWMGAVRDPEDSSAWKWISGRDVTVSFWNLPGGRENCARFDGTKGWLWADTNCRDDLHFVCQHQPLTCGKPEQPPNSTMKPLTYLTGTEVEYECDPGHVLVGPARRTCLPSGFFDGVPPICRYLECGPPAPIRHGSHELLNGTRRFGALVQYTCEPGFTMLDRATLRCDEDKKWDGRPPRCRLNEAPKVPVEEVSQPPRDPPAVDRNMLEDAAPSPSSPSGTVVPSVQHRAPSDDLRSDRASADTPRYSGGGVAMGPRMPLGGLIALAVFGGVVLLTAIVTTIVILVKRSHTSSGKSYLQRSDDITSQSEVSSADDPGLGRHYRRSWDHLSHSAELEKGGHRHARRPPHDDTAGRPQEGVRDGSEMTVSDAAAVYTRPEKRRHHHHRHHHADRDDWRHHHH